MGFIFFWLFFVTESLFEFSSKINIMKLMRLIVLLFALKGVILEYKEFSWLYFLSTSKFYWLGFGFSIISLKKKILKGKSWVILYKNKKILLFTYCFCYFNKIKQKIKKKFVYIFLKKFFVFLKNINRKLRILSFFYCFNWSFLIFLTKIINKSFR